ncbi:MAG: Ribosomal RNA small subunit methyltransferase C [candidate division BRC1 bacterium ADurb.BinA292]|nr:MAG: Ribosomal RNA small subunit methyltransferase C [candidate division BRC1 bacterium ADurb.BinA292]
MPPINPKETAVNHPLKPAIAARPELSLALDAESATVRRERLAGGRIAITSPKGLHPRNALLVEAAAAAAGSHALTVMEPDGMAALVLRGLAPERRVGLWHLDLFHLERAVDVARQNQIERLEIHTGSELPVLDESPDLIILHTQIDSEAGLTLELVRQAHDRLAAGGKLLTCINNPRDQWLRRQLEKTFGNLTLFIKSKGGLVYSCKRTGKPGTDQDARPETRFYVKTVQVKARDTELPFETCYGVFSSDGLDGGSHALLDLLKYPEPCRSILDLGCGWGAMGILAAHWFGAERLVLIDANARAVEMARRNAQRHGLAERTEIRHEANLESLAREAETGAYDLVLSNPPYATDYRVTELFVQAAARALRAGGEAWMVGKNNPRLEALMTAAFGNAATQRHWGYDVVRAEKG